MKLTLFVSAIFIFYSIFPSENDLLTIGKSKHRFDIGKISANQIVDSRSGQAVKIDDMIKRDQKTNVYIIGEIHNSFDCHQFQLDFLKALHKAHPKTVIGFEFFKRSDNPVLEKWRLGEISEEQLLKKTGWFKKSSYHYNYTKMLMDTIREKKIKVIGLNIPRTILRQASRKGYETLSEEEKRLFPTIHVPNRDHRFFIQRIFGDFTMQVPQWFQNIYTAQKMWDVVMAESMIAFMKKNRGYKGMIIAGNNHVVYKLGIPFRYKLSKRKTRITTIVPVHVPEKKGTTREDAHPMMKILAKSQTPIGIYSRGIGDYVYAVKKSSENRFKKFGVGGKFTDQGFHVKSVVKKSNAYDQGIRKGDIIKSVDGVDIKKEGQLGYYLYKHFGKKDLRFIIEKTVKKKNKEAKKNKKMDGKK